MTPCNLFLFLGSGCALHELGKVRALDSPARFCINAAARWAHTTARHLRHVPEHVAGGQQNHSHQMAWQPIAAWKLSATSVPMSASVQDMMVLSAEQKARGESYRVEI